jgi:hypothetical protein
MITLEFCFLGEIGDSSCRLHSGDIITLIDGIEDQNIGISITTRF